MDIYTVYYHYSCMGKTAGVIFRTFNQHDRRFGLFCMEQANVFYDKEEAMLFAKKVVGGTLVEIIGEYSPADDINEVLHSLNPNEQYLLIGFHDKTTEHYFFKNYRENREISVGIYELFITYGAKYIYDNFLMESAEPTRIYVGRRIFT